MDRHFLGGVELHPLLGLTINTTSFSHFQDSLRCFDCRFTVPGAGGFVGVLITFGAKAVSEVESRAGLSTGGEQANKQIPAGIVRNAGAYLIGQLAWLARAPRTTSWVSTKPFTAFD